MRTTNPDGTVFSNGKRTVIALAFVLLAACDATTNSNTTSRPDGPPDACTAIASMDGCEGGSKAFSCTRDLPDNGDVSLVCSAGTPGPAGATLYCCAPYGTAYSECDVSATVTGCTGSAFGFACFGEVAPNEADASIACSAAVPSGSNALYCCSSAVPAATCAADSTVACTGAAIGYTCGGATQPFATDPSIACAPAGGSADEHSLAYCCVSIDPSASTCAPDATLGCSVLAYGFSCPGGATPNAANAAFACSALGSTGTDAAYCCNVQPID